MFSPREIFSCSKRNKAKVHTLGSPREGKVVPLYVASCNHNCKNNVIIIFKIEILECKHNFNSILKSFVWSIMIKYPYFVIKTNYFQKWFLYKELIEFCLTHGRLYFLWPCHLVMESSYCREHWIVQDCCKHESCEPRWGKHQTWRRLNIESVPFHGI